MGGEKGRRKVLPTAQWMSATVSARAPLPNTVRKIVAVVSIAAVKVIA